MVQGCLRNQGDNFFSSYALAFSPAYYLKNFLMLGTDYMLHTCFYRVSFIRKWRSYIQLFRWISYLQLYCFPQLLLNLLILLLLACQYSSTFNLFHSKPVLNLFLAPFHGWMKYLLLDLIFLKYEDIILLSFVSNIF